MRACSIRESKSSASCQFCACDKTPPTDPGIMAAEQWIYATRKQILAIFGSRPACANKLAVKQPNQACRSIQLTCSSRCRKPSRVLTERFMFLQLLEVAQWLG
eukprot:TRINITY_DN52185_c0_g1_i1.p2 TRINITY_DN52185_c0_g1~~TRINITY_DN52185_c0_g1_i1.p2  ORF type:complete len:103 (-),score=8.86 TRINITY_DN52185_c0_g1_i1:32-340(-)